MHRVSPGFSWYNFKGPYYANMLALSFLPYYVSSSKTCLELYLVSVRHVLVIVYAEVLTFLRAENT